MSDQFLKELLALTVSVFIWKDYPIYKLYVLSQELLHFPLIINGLSALLELSINQQIHIITPATHCLVLNVKSEEHPEYRPFSAGDHLYGTILKNIPKLSM